MRLPLADSLELRHFETVQRGRTSTTTDVVAHAAMSKFKALLLNLVAKNLAPTEIGSLRNSFLAMDTDGSGYLTVRSDICVPAPF